MPSPIPAQSSSPATCDVLLFGTMGNIGRAVRDSLLSHNLSVRLVDFPQNTFRDEPGYVRELDKAIQAFAPKMILPIGNQRAMARFKEKTRDIIIPVEGEEKTIQLDSKIRCSALAAEIGILQPRIFRDIEEVNRYPVIFKRDKSFGGNGVYRPRSREALTRLINGEPGSAFLIEDLVEGCDYSVDALRWDGYFRAGCYKSLSNKGQGPSIQRKPEDRPELCAIAQKLLDTVDWHGVCGLDFRVSDSGRAYFLECNPRFTGGIRTQINTGFDIPWLYWQLANQST